MAKLNPIQTGFNMLSRTVVLAGKYFDSPSKFHDAIRHFFEVDYINHKPNLRSLLTLNFQSFENAHLLSA